MDLLPFKISSLTSGLPHFRFLGRHEAKFLVAGINAIYRIVPDTGTTAFGKWSEMCFPLFHVQQETN
jgi:hypothetical protein